MLQSFLWPNVANLPEIEQLRFMQDGAPPHFARSVRQWLDHAFESRWIGRGGLTEWPSRSPDKTPLDFYLWGHVKHLVLERRPQNVEDLKQFICDAIREVNNKPVLCVSFSPSSLFPVGKQISEKLLLNFPSRRKSHNQMQEKLRWCPESIVDFTVLCSSRLAATLPTALTKPEP